MARHKRGHVIVEFDRNVAREDLNGVDSSADLYWIGDHHSLWPVREALAPSSVGYVALG